MAEINWGHGRLQPYESLASIFAKFCALNCISPRQARFFLREVFDASGWSPRHGLTVDQERLLAQVLDEPIEIVSTVTPKDFLLFRPSEPFSFRPENQSNSDAYCPECLKRGYHACFHTLYWLKRCAIHQLDLVPIFPRSLRGVGSEFDTYVLELTVLFREANPRWLVCTNRSSLWPNRGLGVLEEIKRWVLDVHRSIGYMGNDLEVVGGATYDLRNLGVLLGRLNWLSPLSVAAEDCLAVTPAPLTVRRVLLGKHESSEMRRLLSYATLDQLLWFYKRTMYLESEDSPIATAVRNEIAQIQNHHACTCVWGWSRYSGWTRVPPDVWPSATYICPYEAARNELLAGWTSFFANGFQGQNEWDAYVRMASRFSNQGLVSLLEETAGQTPGEWKIGSPCIKWTVENSIAGILLDLVLSELHIRAKEISDWLHCLDHRKPPGDITRTPASIIVFGQPDELVVLEWPPSCSVH